MDDWIVLHLDFRRIKVKINSYLVTPDPIQLKELVKKSLHWYRHSLIPHPPYLSNLMSFELRLFRSLSHYIQDEIFMEYLKTELIDSSSIKKGKTRMIFCLYERVGGREWKIMLVTKLRNNCD